MATQRCASRAAPRTHSSPPWLVHVPASQLHCCSRRAPPTLPLLRPTLPDLLVRHGEPRHACTPPHLPSCSRADERARFAGAGAAASTCSGATAGAAGPQMARSAPCAGAAARASAARGAGSALGCALCHCAGVNMLILASCRRDISSLRVSENVGAEPEQGGVIGAGERRQLARRDLLAARVGEAQRDKQLRRRAARAR